ncbi:MAG: hypothetical protein ACFFD2_22465 [Promethearchaeota archaeon]
MSINEFLIINSKGLILFKFSPDEDLNAEIKSGFFSAIQSFAKTFIDKNKEKYHSIIKIGEFNYNFLCNQLYDIYFILRSAIRDKEKDINGCLKKLEKLFIEEFRMDLIGFNGNTSKFQRFNKVLEKFLEK